MQGDFTRDTFDPAKHYDRALMQQGRVQLDADWNEQAAIVTRRDQTAVEDLTGHCGGNADAAAFGVLTAAQAVALGLPAAPAGDFYLSAGRYYVDGIQCELEKPVLFTQQPDRTGVSALADGKHLLYLDVWHSHLTALHDDSLLDPALGGVDTATRVKTVWQVRATPTDADDCPAGAGEVAGLQRQQLPQLKARTRPEATPDDPCQLPETAGYKGLENQLYRVEIHDGGGADVARFKWSRENGSVVTAIKAFTDTNGSILTVAGTGRDDALGFHDGQIVELLDDRREWEGLPGMLAVIDGEPQDNQIKLKALGTDPLPVPANIDLGLHSKLRRWEGIAVVTQPAGNNGYLDLERGVEIRFDAHGTGYHTGDYWLIPTRAATATAPAGDIEWPRDPDAQGKPDNSKPRPQPPRGITHHFCSLGLITVAAGVASPSADCRCLWPAFTSVPRLFYVSGDGQEVMPILEPGAAGPFRLPQPLIVGIANAQCLPRPLLVRFSVIAPSGGRVASSGGGPLVPITDVPVGAKGLAACQFHLDPDNPSQQVTARLLDESGQEVSLPLTFNANLSQASQVAYKPGDCSLLKDARNVQEALDRLCRAMHRGCEWTVGRNKEFPELNGDFPTLGDAYAELAARKHINDWRLCLLEGKHPFLDPSEALKTEERDPSEIRLRLSGSQGAVLSAKERVTFLNLASLTMRDLAVELGGNSTIRCEGCDDVELTNCRIAGGDVELGAVQLLAGKSKLRRIRLTANQILVKSPAVLHSKLALLIESAAADCWMEDNVVKGWISLDGFPTEKRDRFADWARKPIRNPDLSILKVRGGEWHLRGNHLDGVTTGGPLAAALLELIEGKAQKLSFGFQEIFAHGNTMVQGINLVFAQHVHLEATSFAFARGPACLVFANRGTFVGNQGTDLSFVLAKIPAKRFREAANLIKVHRI